MPPKTTLATPSMNAPLNPDEISKRLSLALGKNKTNAQAQALLVEAFGTQDWGDFCNIVKQVGASGPQRAELSRVDFHSRMLHMMKAPRKEKEASLEHFKQLAMEANYDFCALHRKEDGWSIACKHYYGRSQSDHVLSMIDFMLEQGSNPLESESKTALFWNNNAPHDRLIDWVIKHEAAAPKRTKQGGNPIHYFVLNSRLNEYHYKQAFELLKDKKIPKEWVNQGDHAGLTPLHYTWASRIQPQKEKRKAGDDRREQRERESSLVNLWLKTFALIQIGADIEAVYPPTQKPLSFHMGEGILKGDGVPEMLKGEVQSYDQLKAIEARILISHGTSQTTAAGSARRL